MEIYHNEAILSEKLRREAACPSTSFHSEGLGELNPLVWEMEERKGIKYKIKKMFTFKGEGETIMDFGTYVRFTEIEGRLVEMKEKMLQKPNVKEVTFMDVGGLIVSISFDTVDPNEVMKALHSL
jgi:hypothetical protein